MASQWAAAVGVRPAPLVAPATLFPQIAVKKLSAPHKYVKSKKITKPGKKSANSSFFNNTAPIVSLLCFTSLQVVAILRLPSLTIISVDLLLSE